MGVIGQDGFGGVDAEPRVLPVEEHLFGLSPRSLGHVQSTRHAGCPCGPTEQVQMHHASPVTHPFLGAIPFYPPPSEHRRVPHDAGARAARRRERDTMRGGRGFAIAAVLLLTLARVRTAGASAPTTTLFVQSERLDGTREVWVRVPDDG